MVRIAAILLVAMVTFPGAYGQQVQRAWVGFEDFYYEAAWTNTHAIVEVVCGSEETEYDIEVGYETADGTALAGRDYTETKGSHLFHAGSPTRTIKIEIPLLTRALDEDKTFRIRVTRADFPGEVSRTRGDVPVTITGLPKLELWRFDTNLYLKWRASATNFTLEANSTVMGSEWEPVSGETNPIPFEPDHILIMPLAAESRFYRLRTTVSERGF